MPGVLRFSGLRRVSASRHSDHSRALIIVVVFGDAIKNHATRPFRRAGVEPQTLPPTWRKFLMKNSILVTLPLAAVLAFPAFAQTSSTQTQATTPATTQ